MSSIPKLKSLYWTQNARHKMKFYGLSEARVRRIINSPKRTEEGIAPKTTALMQTAGTSKHPHELWAMIQDSSKRRTVISAWCYPGVTRPKSAAAVGEIKREYNEFVVGKIGQAN